MRKHLRTIAAAGVVLATVAFAPAAFADEGTKESREKGEHVSCTCKALRGTSATEKQAITKGAQSARSAADQEFLRQVWESP